MNEEKDEEKSPKRKDGQNRVDHGNVLKKKRLVKSPSIGGMSGMQSRRCEKELRLLLIRWGLIDCARFRLQIDCLKRCHTLADRKESPETIRYQLLIGLMLSSQTKDPSKDLKRKDF